MSTTLINKTIVNFGDSIFGNFRAPNDISSYISELSGATVYNVGFGGCRMGVHPHAQFDKFCMYRVVDAVTSRDFSLLDEAVSVAPENDALPKYFRDSLIRLRCLKASILTVSTFSRSPTAQTISPVRSGLTAVTVPMWHLSAARFATVSTS